MYNLDTKAQYINMMALITWQITHLFPISRATFWRSSDLPRPPTLRTHQAPQLHHRHLRLFWLVLAILKPPLIVIAG
jgi:hypothetical protein